jgi:phenylacetate-coenzyme A ligase PaaK-like adenylate-forming protein
MITSMGTDATVFKERIRKLWGRMPLTIYGNTETIVAGTQTWDYKDMVFFPNLNFYEFIPEEELVKERQNNYYHPNTVLLSELEKGKFYEVVITNLHGGSLVRYRLGDLIRVSALRNEALGINLPQFTLEGRTDDLIDLGFIRLNERVIWEGLEKTEIRYKDWTALKEIDENPQLHLYLELAPGYYISSEEVAKRLYNAIKNLSDGLYVYKEIDKIDALIDFRPVKVTILPQGTFSAYKRARQSEGAMLSDLKPPHVNPSLDDLGLLALKLPLALKH